MKTINSKMPFGKHKGVSIVKLPQAYLTWMTKNLRNSDFHEYAVLAEQVLNSSDIKMESHSANLDEQATAFLKSHGFNEHGA